MLVFVLAVAVSFFFYFGAGVYCASEAVLLWGVNFLVVVVVQSGVLY